jgi:hypothetical protein
MRTSLDSWVPSRFEETKQHFTCVEQLTGTLVYGEVKILMMILNMSVIRWRSVCGTHWSETAISPFCFEEPVVTVTNTSLRHVFMGTISQLGSAVPHFSRRIRVFLDREFPDYWMRIVEFIPGHSPDLNVLDWFLLLGHYKGHCLHLKSAKCEWVALPKKHLPTPDEKLKIVWMWVVPLMVPILRSAEHIKNSLRPSVSRFIDFFNINYGWKYILFYFAI